jgi:D-alanyl-D-alanine carboxypeptidase/D-alanyl-D-alanine-endopeptidase (penicillin-binding protein 4)
LNRAGASVAVTVRVDGVGDVVSQNADQLLVPASNQKLLVAVAAFEALPLDERLETTVVATGPTIDGEVRGDLVLVGGGDPGLMSSAARGLDSLDALVASLQARGITRVQGRLLVDEGRYDAERVAPGWPANAWASNIGPLSALVVNRNREGQDPAYLTDPAMGNAASFVAALGAAGITVAGPVEHGASPPGERLAAVSSLTLRELVAEMLSKSDNLVAEILVKELGYRYRGIGSTAEGLAVAREVVAGLCVAFDGNDADGSGLSRDDHHSARALRELLEVARTRPWWPTFRDALPLAGRSGTLTTRLAGPSTAGNVRAKTGSTMVSRALSGYVTTAGGRQTVFSILINTPNAAAEPAIDAFVTAVAQLPN